jgi:flagellar biosynthesis/type III secretory pathway protein FliH
MLEFALRLHAPLLDFVPSEQGNALGTEAPHDAKGATPAERPRQPVAGSATANAAVTEAQILAALHESFQDVCMAIDQLEQRRRNSLREMQELAIELAVSVAERVTRERIVEGKHAIEKLVAEMVEQFQPDLPLAVKLHPDDLRLLQERLETADGVSTRTTQLTLEPDSTLARGSCRMNTVGFGLSTDVQTQVGMIRQRLLNGMDDAQLERRQTAERDRHLQRFPDRRETA